MPNQALRIMSGSGHRTYHMYEEMNWLSLKNRRLMYKCIMVYKYLNEGAVKTFWDILPQICASVLQYDRAIWGGHQKLCILWWAAKIVHTFEGAVKTFTVIPSLSQMINYFQRENVVLSKDGAKRSNINYKCIGSYQLASCNLWWHLKLNTMLMKIH